MTCTFHIGGIGLWKRRQKPAKNEAGASILERSQIDLPTRYVPEDAPLYRVGDKRRGPLVTIGLLPEELPRVMVHDEYPNFRWVRTAVVILKHFGIGGVLRGSRGKWVWRSLSGT